MTSLLCLLVLAAPSDAKEVLAEAREYYASKENYSATIDSVQHVAGNRIRYRHTLEWSKGNVFELRFVQTPGFLGQPDYVSDGEKLKAIWSDRSVTEHDLFNPRLRLQPWEEYGGPVLSWLVRDADMEDGLQPWRSERVEYSLKTGKLDDAEALIVQLEYMRVGDPDGPILERTVRLYFNPNNAKELWAMERVWHQVTNWMYYYPAGTPVGTIRQHGLQDHGRANQG